MWVGVRSEILSFLTGGLTLSQGLNFRYSSQEAVWPLPRRTLVAQTPEAWMPISYSLALAAIAPFFGYLQDLFWSSKYYSWVKVWTPSGDVLGRAQVTLLMRLT